MEPITGVKRSAEALEATEVFPIQKLPIDVLMVIFYTMTLDDVNSAKKCALVCKRWARVMLNPLIQQVFVQKKYQHLLPSEDVTPSYYTQATQYAQQLNRLSFVFVGKEKTLLAYNDYMKNLERALDKPEAFFNALPYFDLRPFAWLQPKDWERMFAAVAPKLRNVQILETSGIGTRIDFSRIHLFYIPVAIDVLKVGTSILTDLGEIFFPLSTSEQEKRRAETGNRLMLSIGAVAATSKMLRTLIAHHSILTPDQFHAIFTVFDTIKQAKTDVWGIKKSELERDFPNIVLE